MAYLEGNQTILTGIPNEPPGFINVTSFSGMYVIGNDRFSVRDIKLAPFFYRSYGGEAEDFILGVLSVLFISVLSEIVQAIFLRTRHNQVSSQGLFTAYLIDEFAHFRNVWTHATSYSKHAQALEDAQAAKRALEENYEPGAVEPDEVKVLLRQRGVKLSLFVLLMALAIFAADVFAVFVTQPKKFSSSEFQYNLRGVQPVGTYPYLAKYIRRISAVRPCVSPFFEFEEQQREYVLNTCINYDSNSTLNGEEDEATQVSIGSWYHRGGSDHEVRFGEGRESMMIRAEVFFHQNGKRNVNRILFNESESELQHVRYLHEVTMFAILQSACNEPDAQVSCSQLVDELVRTSSVPKRRVIDLWTVRREIVNETVMGIESTYSIRLRNPLRAVNDGLRVLASSSAIEEVEGPAWYESRRGRNSSFREEGLLSEEGRIAGVPLLGLIVLLLILILTALRYALRPMSLAAVAFEYLEDGDEANREADVEKEGYEDEIEKVFEMERGPPSQDLSDSFLWSSSTIGTGTQSFETIWNKGRGTEGEELDQDRWAAEIQGENLRKWKKSEKNSKGGEFAAKEFGSLELEPVSRGSQGNTLDSMSSYNDSSIEYAEGFSERKKNRCWGRKT